MTHTIFENSQVKFEVLHPHKIVELTMTTKDFDRHYCRIWGYQLPYFNDFVEGKTDKFDIYECVYDATNRNLDVMFTLQNGNLVIDAIQSENDVEDEYWRFVVDSEHVPEIFGEIKSVLKG